ncbi:MAG: transposase [Candidatus Wukongarchaeota archaeon]|nr:transposase [Candidatus Wukongarchaeota archaeon]
MDPSWNKFIQYLFYTAERAGKTVLEVNPAGMSQECYKCGEKVKKSLAVRNHGCPTCGLEIDKDYNSCCSLEKRFRGSGRAGTIRIYVCGDGTSTERNLDKFSR